MFIWHSITPSVDPWAQEFWRLNKPRERVFSHPTRLETCVWSFDEARERVSSHPEVLLWYSDETKERVSGHPARPENEEGLLTFDDPVRPARWE